MRDTKGPKGINGWLILPTMQLFLGALIWSANVLIWGSVLLSEKRVPHDLVYFLASLPLAFLCWNSLVLEFKKKKQFPERATTTLWVGVAVTLILALTENDFSDFFPAVIGAIIWGAYFESSKRVKNTFVK